MASSLESPHWEALPPETRQLLETVGAFSFCHRYADTHESVETFQSIAWDEVKSYFIIEAKRLAKLWFSPLE